MKSFELDKVELPALEQLQSLGWSYVEGAKLSIDKLEEMMRGYLKELGYE